jgi:hypothetical protein
MAILSRRLSTSLIAAAVLAAVAVTPSFAQVTPGNARNGPAGGTPSTTAPSNSEGTPAGGTGVLSTTQVGPAGSAASTAATPGDGYSATPRRHRAAMQQSGSNPALQSDPSTGPGSSAGLNGSNRISN